MKIKSSNNEIRFGLKYYKQNVSDLPIRAINKTKRRISDNFDS